MRSLIRACALCSAVPGFFLLSVAPFTRPVTPARDRMDEHKRSVIGFQWQRFVIGFQARHID
jgi:hypothetical protein